MNQIISKYVPPIVIIVPIIRLIPSIILTFTVHQAIAVVDRNTPNVRINETVERARGFVIYSVSVLVKTSFRCVFRVSSSSQKAISRSVVANSANSITGRNHLVYCIVSSISV